MTTPKQLEARLAFLEAAYACELPQQEWLARLCEAAANLWGNPASAYGFVYDASDTSNFRHGPLTMTRGPEGFDQVILGGLAYIKTLPSQVIASTYRSVPVGFGKPIGITGGAVTAALNTLAASDLFGINGLDPSGKGCMLGMAVDRAEMSTDDMLMYQRLACHLASAYRMRRKLAELQQQSVMDDWEALLDTEGRLVDARGPATAHAERAALGRAGQSMQDVRHHKTDDEPLDRWLPRVRGRWTLVDTFDRGGERYLVARENQAAAPGLGALTERERQVVASAVTGKTPKEIAYDLGVSHATVRVLLGRARTRLGAASTEELFALPAIRALRGETGDSG